MAERLCPTCGNPLPAPSCLCPGCGTALPASTGASPSALSLRPRRWPDDEGETPSLPGRTSGGSWERGPLALRPDDEGETPALPGRPSALRPDDEGETPLLPGCISGLWPSVWWLLGGVSCLMVLVVLLNLGTLTGLLAPATTPTASSGSEPTPSPEAGGVIEDDFSKPQTSHLEIVDDATTRAAYVAGAYVLAAKQPKKVVWALIGGPYQDVTFQVDATPVAGSKLAGAGLIFHYQDKDNFYLYSVTGDGYYTLELFQAGKLTMLLDPTQSDKISVEGNTLRVETNGDRIALWVNGTLLEMTSDGTFTTGAVGLAVSSFERSTGAISFDNLVVR